MTVPKLELLEARVLLLEAQVKALTERWQASGNGTEPTTSWLDSVYGAFEGDPDYEEAMRLGREYRDSLRPKPTKRKSKTSAKKVTV